MSAPFRIHRPPRVQRVAGEAAADQREQFKLYLDRLLRLIPAEVVSLYLIGSGLIPEGEDVALLIWSIVCLVGVVVVRAYMTTDPEAGLPPQWRAVIISCVSFAIWVYTMGGPFMAMEIHEPYVGSLLVMAWTFFVPYFYKGD